MQVVEISDEHDIGRKSGIDMRTVFISRRPGTLRGVPITAGRGHSQALPPRVVAHLRSASLVAPGSPVPDPTRPKTAQSRHALHTWRCTAHGIFRSETGQCPSGCSRVFAEPLWDLGAQPARPVPQATRAVSLLMPDRDERGRFLSDPHTSRAALPHRDETMSATDVRVQLRRLLSHLPRGAARPLARLCGYRGRWCLHSLRGVAKGGALLPEACRRRISRILSQVLRHDLVLIETGRSREAGCPSHAWCRRTPAVEARAVDFQH